MTPLNLRHDPTNASRLTAVGTRRFQLPGFKPVGMSDGGLWLTRNFSLYFIEENSESDEPTPVFTARGEIRDVIPLRQGCVRVLADDAIRTLRLDPAKGWKAIAAPSDLPGITLAPTGTSPIKAVVRSIDLHGDYSGHETQLTQADASLVGDRLLQSYMSLRASAAALGRHVNPVLARWIAEDADGNTILQGPPVLIATEASQQFQLVADIDMNQERTATVQATIQVQTYGLRVEIHPSKGFDHSEVASLRIEMTPEIEPNSLSESPSVTFIARSDGSRFVRAVLAPSATPPGEATIEAMAARLDKLWKTVARIHHPFDGERHVINPPVDAALYTSADAEQRALRSVLAQSPDLATSSSAVHLVTARCGSRQADTLLLGALCRNRSDGHDILSLSASVTSDLTKRWRGYVAVTMADGERVVRLTEGRGAAPASLNACLSYPSAEATRIDVGVSVEGSGDFAASVGLTPSADGSCALFVSPDLTAVPLVASPEFLIPAHTSRPTELLGAVAAQGLDSNAPLSPAVEMSAREIVAVEAAPGTSSGWDYRHSRFYIFAGDGIRQVTVDSRTHTIRANALIDHRGVCRRDAVAVTSCTPCASALKPSAVMALTSAGELLSISGNKANMIATPGGHFLCWDGTRRELWCVDRSGSVMVFETDTLTFYRRSGEAPDGSLNTGAEGALAFNHDLGIMRLDRCEEISADTFVNVELRKCYADGITLEPRLRQRCRRVAGTQYVRIMLDADMLAGPQGVSLRAVDRWGNVDCNHIIRGRLDKSRSFSVHNPMRGEMSLILTGEMTPGSSILKLELFGKQQ